MVVKSIARFSLWSIAVSTMSAEGFPPIADLFEERASTTVYVSFTVELEMERQRANAVGLVVDDEGLVVLLGPAMPDWLPPDQLIDLRVHAANSVGNGFAAEYLGIDDLNGWHYLRAEESGWNELRPITGFPAAGPTIGEELWGICLTDENLDFLPYYRYGRLSAHHGLPLMTGFLTDDVATPGGPIFNRAGAFVGWSGVSIPVEREAWIGGEYYRVSIRNPDESYTFLFAEPFLENVARVPPSVLGSPRPWLGISGLQPLDGDTAEFLGLEQQGALIVSRVLAEGPAAEAGVRNRDIIVAIDGERLPRLKPDSVVPAYVEREIKRRSVGDSMRFTLVRGQEEIELEVRLGDGPVLVREAPREYLEPLGITIRELVLSDALQRRVEPREMAGVMTSFVRPNSPPASAGLAPGDWILEIEGDEVTTLEEAIAAFEVIMNREESREYVLLVSRNNETTVLRVRQD